jgi:RHS repeat-associated protein
VQTRDYSLDATGNTTRAGNQRYTYNQNNRLIEAAENNATVGSYSYNVRGQRVIKATGSSSTTVYHYDQSGLLIAESDAAGTTIAEYLYLNGQPLAKIEGGNTSYIHPDHLGTPVRMTDATGQKVWQIENRPFGDSPRITGTQDLNLRFPGQYYDQETGLHQNWHRDYQPEIGRYVEADPIGFRGGLNLFIYVQNNPTNYTDTRGLFPIYGNYCGPDWTGGYEGSWGNLTQTQRSNLHGPVDALDSCCESHDRRYETCRNTYPCDSVQRQACFEMADRELSRCANKSGAPGLGAYAVENYMKHSNPGAGKDAQKCSCP